MAIRALWVPVGYVESPDTRVGLEQTVLQEPPAAKVPREPPEQLDYQARKVVLGNLGLLERLVLPAAVDQRDVMDSPDRPDWLELPVLWELLVLRGRLVRLGPRDWQVWAGQKERQVERAAPDRRVQPEQWVRLE